tara:strand:- start:374 stop:526 length:153 start_codon:yes stop_codon:yes gene_type:complete
VGTAVVAMRTAHMADRAKTAVMNTERKNLPKKPKRNIRAIGIIKNKMDNK